MSTKNKLLRLFMGKHLIEMARATDADPEKIMDAAEALNEPDEAVDKKAKDGELPPALKENEFKSDDKKGKDENEDGGAMDAKAKDRKAARDAFDRAFDKAKGKDANIDALKTLLDEFLTEEKAEPEHMDDEEADPAELEEVLAGEAEDCPECGMAHDESECPGEEEVESGEEVMDEEGESPDPDSDDDQEDVEDRKRAADGGRARAADAAMATLRMLRPYAARTTDKNFQKAFNRALDSVKKTSRASTGSYGAFASSARARDKAPRNPNPDRARAGDGKADPINTMQDFYNKSHKGGK